jgi:hypothetical protein
LGMGIGGEEGRLSPGEEQPPLAVNGSSEKIPMRSLRDRNGFF